MSISKLIHELPCCVLCTEESISRDMCHGTTSLLPSFPLSPLRPPPGKPPSTLRFHPTSSASTPPPFRFNSDVYVRNWQDYVAQALRITVDQCRTHPDLVPMPRAAVCIPLPHLSYSVPRNRCNVCHFQHSLFIPLQPKPQKFYNLYPRCAYICSINLPNI